MVCAPTEFILVLGGYHFPLAYEHLDGWHITGQCLLCYLIVPLTVHNQTETLISKFPQIYVIKLERMYQKTFISQDLLPLAGPYFLG